MRGLGKLAKLGRKCRQIRQGNFIFKNLEWIDYLYLGRSKLGELGQLANPTQKNFGNLKSWLDFMRYTIKEQLVDLTFLHLC